MREMSDAELTCLEHDSGAAVAAAIGLAADGVRSFHIDGLVSSRGQHVREYDSSHSWGNFPLTRLAKWASWQGVPARESIAPQTALPLAFAGCSRLPD